MALKTAPVAAGTTTSPEVVKAGKGKLYKILVTADATAQLNLYDHATAAAGTIIGVVKANAKAGDVTELNFPFDNGLTAGKVNGSPPVTVYYSA